MNLPNKLTVSRFVMTGIFVGCMAGGEEYDVLHAPGRAEGWNFAYTAALVLFLAAVVTDFLDGEIARRRGLETNFGKLMDPLADKVMMAAGFITLVPLKAIPAWVVICIISREFLITGLRLVATSKGIVLPAEKIGKHKRVKQIMEIIRLRPEGFGVLSGDDALTMPLIAAGADGVSARGHRSPRKRMVVAGVALRRMDARRRGASADALLRSRLFVAAPRSHRGGIARVLQLALHFDVVTGEDLRIERRVFLDGLAAEKLGFTSTNDLHFIVRIFTRARGGRQSDAECHIRGPRLTTRIAHSTTNNDESLVCDEIYHDRGVGEYFLVPKTLFDRG